MEVEVLSATDKYNEYIMTGLRTIWGVSLNRIATEFGPKFKEYALLQADKFIDEHLLFVKGDVLKTTKKGMFFINKSHHIAISALYKTINCCWYFHVA